MSNDAGVNLSRHELSDDQLDRVSGGFLEQIVKTWNEVTGGREGSQPQISDMTITKTFQVASP
jgi:hypothetical protein